MGKLGRPKYNHATRYVAVPSPTTERADEDARPIGLMKKQRDRPFLLIFTDSVWPCFVMASLDTLVAMRLRPNAMSLGSLITGIDPESCEPIECAENLLTEVAACVAFLLVAFGLAYLTGLSTESWPVATRKALVIAFTFLCLLPFGFAFATWSMFSPDRGRLRVQHGLSEGAKPLALLGFFLACNSFASVLQRLTEDVSRSWRISNAATAVASAIGGNLAVNALVVMLSILFNDELPGALMAKSVICCCRTINFTVRLLSEHVPDTFNDLL